MTLPATLPPYPPAVGPGTSLHSDFNFIYRALLNDITAPPQLPPLPAPSNSFVHSDLNFIYQAILAMNAREMGDFSYRGVYDASSNLFPSTGGSGTGGAVMAGDVWNISVAGTLGSTSVYIGYTIRALVNSPGQTASDWNIMNVGYGYVPLNRAGDSMTGNLKLAAGTTSMSPLTLQSGTNLITAAQGNVEFDGAQLYFTPSTTRNILAQVSGASALTAATIIFTSASNGYITGDSSLTYSTSTGMATSKPYANSYAGTASVNSFTISGSPYSAGSSTTNFPQFLMQDGSASTAWSSSGTYFGVNGKSGFTGNLLDIQFNGTSRLVVNYLGNSGFNVSTPTANHHIVTTSSWIAWASNSVAPTGKGFVVDAATLTDTSTAAGTTVAYTTGNSFGAVTFASTLATSGSNVTYTSPYGNYFFAPVAGTNVALTNAWTVGIGGSFGLVLRGNLFGSGTSTTNKPVLLIEPAGTPSTGWDGNGTYFGINASATNASIMGWCFNGNPLWNTHASSTSLSSNQSVSWNWNIGNALSFSYIAANAQSSVNFFNNNGSIGGNGSTFNMFKFSTTLAAGGVNDWNQGNSIYINTVFNLTSGGVNTVRSVFIDPTITSANTNRVRALETSGGQTLFGNSFPYYTFASSLLGIGFRANATIDANPNNSSTVTNTLTTITDPNTTSGTFASIVGASFDGVTYKATASGAGLTITDMYSVYIAASLAPTGITVTNNWTLGVAGNQRIDGMLVSNWASGSALPAINLQGVWFTGATPHVLIQPSGTSSSSWSATGTAFGINAATGFTGNLIDLQLNGTSEFSIDHSGNLLFGGNLTVADGKNIVLNTTTGTKIGTGTSQKIGLWNTSPIAQPTTSIAGATYASGGGLPINANDTYDGYTVAQVVKALRNFGLLA